MHNCFATKGRLLGALKNQGCLCTGLASTKGILPGVWYSGEDPMCVCVYVDNRWQSCVWIRIYHAHCVYMIYTFWQNACLFVCLLACLFVCLLYFFNLLHAYHHFLQTSCPFAQMDVNGDGVLSREEFVAMRWVRLDEVLWIGGIGALRQVQQVHKMGAVTKMGGFFSNNCLSHQTSTSIYIISVFGWFKLHNCARKRDAASVVQRGINFDTVNGHAWPGAQIAQIWEPFHPSHLQLRQLLLAPLVSMPLRSQPGFLS